MSTNSKDSTIEKNGSNAPAIGTPESVGPQTRQLIVKTNLEQDRDFGLNSQPTVSRGILKPDSDPFPRYMLISLILQGFGLAVGLLSLLGIIILFLRPPPSLVQLSDGTPITVKPFSSTYRSPENLKHFAVAVARGLFTWSSQISRVDEFGQAKLVRDEGKPIEGDNGRTMTIPTAVWESGFWLSSDFRQPFLQRIAELIPSNIAGGTETYLQVRQVTDPIELGEGKWKVAVIADIVWSDPKMPPLQVNKVYYLSLSTPSLSQDELTEFQQQVGRVTRWGLTVTDIKDFKEESHEFIR